MKFRIISVVVVCSMWTSNVHAQDTAERTENAENAAAEAFRQGLDAYDNSEFDMAAALFRQANALNLNWKLLFNIGQSEAAAKRYGLALQAFEEYLSRGGDDIVPQRRDEVLTEIERLKQMLGILEVEGPKGANVLVDGEKRDSLPLMGPILLPAGIAHEVVVVLDGRELLRRTLRISGGRSARLMATDSNQTAPAPQDETTNDGSEDTESDNVSDEPMVAADIHHPRKIAGPIIMAAGVSVIGGGLIVGGIALKNGNQLEKDNPAGVPSSHREDVRAVNNMALAADILIPAGAAIVVTGFVIGMVQRKRANERPVAAVPVLTPTLAGAAFRGSF